MVNMFDHPKSLAFVALLFLPIAFAGNAARRGAGYEFAADYEGVIGQVRYNFTCQNRTYGYYADQFQDCKVFHICSPVSTSTGRPLKTLMFSFFCPDMTRFSQDSKTCISENFAYPCDLAHTLYDENGQIGHYMPRTRAEIEKSEDEHYSSEKSSGFANRTTKFFAKHRFQSPPTDIRVQVTPASNIQRTRHQSQVDDQRDISAEVKEAQVISPVALKKVKPEIVSSRKKIEQIKSPVAKPSPVPIRRQPSRIPQQQTTPVIAGSVLPRVAPEVTSALQRNPLQIKPLEKSSKKNIPDSRPPIAPEVKPTRPVVQRNPTNTHSSRRLVQQQTPTISGSVLPPSLEHHLPNSHNLNNVGEITSNVPASVHLNLPSEKILPPPLSSNRFSPRVRKIAVSSAVQDAPKKETTKKSKSKTSSSFKFNQKIGRTSNVINRKDSLIIELPGGISLPNETPAATRRPAETKPRTESSKKPSGLVSFSSTVGLQRNQLPTSGARSQSGISTDQPPEIGRKKNIAIRKSRIETIGAGLTSAKTTHTTELGSSQAALKLTNNARPEDRTPQKVVKVDDIAEKTRRTKTKPEYQIIVRHRVSAVDDSNNQFIDTEIPSKAGRTENTFEDAIDLLENPTLTTSKPKAKKTSVYASKRKTVEPSEELSGRGRVRTRIVKTNHNANAPAVPQIGNENVRGVRIGSTSTIRSGSRRTQQQNTAPLPKKDSNSSIFDQRFIQVNKDTTVQRENTDSNRSISGTKQVKAPEIGNTRTTSQSAQAVNIEEDISVSNRRDSINRGSQTAHPGTASIRGKTPFIRTKKVRLPEPEPITRSPPVSIPNPTPRTIPTERGQKKFVPSPQFRQTFAFESSKVSLPTSFVAEGGARLVNQGNSESAVNTNARANSRARGHRKRVIIKNVVKTVAKAPAEKVVESLVDIKSQNNEAQIAEQVIEENIAEVSVKVKATQTPTPKPKLINSNLNLKVISEDSKQSLEIPAVHESKKPIVASVKTVRRPVSRGQRQFTSTGSISSSNVRRRRPNTSTLVEDTVTSITENNPEINRGSSKTQLGAKDEAKIVQSRKKVTSAKRISSKKLVEPLNPINTVETSRRVTIQDRILPPPEIIVNGNITPPRATSPITRQPIRTPQKTVVIKKDSFERSPVNVQKKSAVKILKSKPVDDQTTVINGNTPRATSPITRQPIRTPKKTVVINKNSFERSPVNVQKKSAIKILTSKPVDDQTNSIIETVLRGNITPPRRDSPVNRQRIEPPRKLMSRKPATVDRTPIITKGIQTTEQKTIVNNIITDAEVMLSDKIIPPTKDFPADLQSIEIPNKKVITDTVKVDRSRIQNQRKIARKQTLRKAAVTLRNPVVTSPETETSVNTKKTQISEASSARTDKTVSTQAGRISSSSSIRGSSRRGNRRLSARRLQVQQEGKVVLETETSAKEIINAAEPERNIRISAAKEETNVNAKEGTQEVNNSKKDGIIYRRQQNRFANVKVKKTPAQKNVSTLKQIEVQDKQAIVTVSQPIQLQPEPQRTRGRRISSIIANTRKTQTNRGRAQKRVKSVKKVFKVAPKSSEEVEDDSIEDIADVRSQTPTAERTQRTGSSQSRGRRRFGSKRVVKLTETDSDEEDSDSFELTNRELSSQSVRQRIGSSPTTKKKVSQQTISEPIVKQHDDPIPTTNISTGRRRVVKKKSPLKFKVVGTSVKSTVSKSSGEGEVVTKALKTVKRVRNGNTKSKTSDEPLTDLELEALRSLARVSQAPSSRRVIRRRVVKRRQA